MMRLRLVFAFALLLASFVCADTLKLKDGSKLEGRVIPQSDSYWVKLTDGSTRTVKKQSVAEWTRGNAVGSAGAPRGPNFQATKSRADRCDVPIAAVALWQTFIDANEGSPELPAAEKEKAFWQKRVEDKAEKIRGKWVGGEERKALLDKVGRLVAEADHLMKSNQTLQAVAKLEEINRIYPNHFGTNFLLGLTNLQQSKFEKAQVNLENALRVNPESPEALTDYAIVLNQRKQYEKAVLTALKAAEIKDSREIVQNLVNTIYLAPPAMREHNKNVQPAIKAATILASKYGIGGPAPWVYVYKPLESKPMPGDTTPRADAADLPAGVIGMGSGFLINADGLIVTNRHVASVGDILMVRLSDGTQKPAERLVMDDGLDLALIRIKPDKPLPFLTIAADAPGPGAECTALGYPAGHIFGITLQVSPGTVSSIIKEKHADVVVNCKINPGNSGGPLVDRFGNVAGVVTFKTRSDAMTDSYGLAIGAGRVREFLKKHADKLDATPADAPADAAALNTEGVYKKVSPAAVCIIMIRSGDKTDAK